MNTQITSRSAWIFSLENSKKMSQVGPGTVKTPEEDTHSHPMNYGRAQTVSQTTLGVSGRVFLGETHAWITRLRKVDCPC